MREQVEGNAHSVLWVRILNAREGVGGQARIKSNMLVSDCTLAPLYALRKDHKNIDDPSIDLPVRPVCGAMFNSLQQEIVTSDEFYFGRGVERREERLFEYCGNVS